MEVRSFPIWQSMLRVDGGSSTARCGRLLGNDVVGKPETDKTPEEVVRLMES